LAGAAAAYAIGTFSAVVVTDCSTQPQSYSAMPSSQRQRLFGLGYSWGGYESLIIPAEPAALRTATAWRAEGPCLRLHIGLEDPQDLICDLEAGLARLRQAP